MKISLHLGAHKTASTFIQKVLERNAAALASHGVRVVPMETFRQMVTRQAWPRPDLDPAQNAARSGSAAAYLRGLLRDPGAARLVLSDENLIGAPNEMVAVRQPYPDPARKLAPFARMLAGQEVEIFLAIRHLGQFGRSLFCESLRSKSDVFTRPEDFKAGWKEGGTSWLPLIGVLRATFPGAPLTLWNFPTFKEDPQRILNAIAGLDPAHDFDLEGAYQRPSLSHDATVALLEIGAREGPAAMQAVQHEIGLANPRREGNWAYRMWEPGEGKVFQKRLREDLKAIAAMAPAVRLIG